eukprot:jgi/Chlat1/7682/Chrsp64S07148
MVLYNFKKITVVPSAKDLVDIVLSKTQRTTPTVIHKSYAITRIRAFYMRKVKFTSSTYHDRITTILEDFPRVDDIHPFYADLLNVLYDKDHYKLALGQLHAARNLIDKMAKDYVRLLKFGDSLYRCKQLKRAAMGRMCTLMKKLTASLAYLEQVRQHMSRLPSIDPNTRTILICGYPNVGKSSFMNKVTRADVDVQPYAFTTKSLFVGHTDYKYLRWQVIDTPGILDHPLEQRNTIEMQSITALAHLRATVLYFVDISERCGYTLAQQAALFHSIKPLFANKPLMIVCNKVDARPLESLTEDERNLLEDMRKEAAGGEALMADGGEQDDALLTMSTLTEVGISQVKAAACEKLLALRVEMKMRGKKVHDVLNRIHVATPVARDASARPPVIPSAVLAAREQGKAVGQSSMPRTLEKDLENDQGGAGVYVANWRKNYILEDDSWKEDIMPEVIDGHNIADFIDADILQRLEELEREEERLEEEAEFEENMSEGEELTAEEAATLSAIRKKKKKMLQEHRRKKAVASNNSVVPRKYDHARNSTTDNMRAHLADLGMDPTKAVERARSRSKSQVRVGRKRGREEAGMDIDEAGAEGEGQVMNRAARRRALSKSRGRQIISVPGDGFKDIVQKTKAQKLADMAQRVRNKDARKGEGDRHIPDLKPKHLLVGKRKKGTANHR